MTNRNSKAIWASLLLALVAGALSASPATAFFDSEAAHISLTGTQTTEHRIVTSAGTVSCKKSSFSGTSLATKEVLGGQTRETLTAHPTYSECTAFGFKATVTTTGCDFVLTRTGESPVGTPIGPLHISCEAGKKIAVAAAGFCTMEFPGQTPGGHVGYMNQGSEFTRDISIEFTLSAIKYEGNCGSGSNGTYTGSETLQANNTGGSQTGLWIT